MNHSIVLEQDTRQGVQLSKKQKKKLKRLQNVTSTGEQSASPVPQLPKQGDAARQPSKQSSGWNFAAEYNDHFETPVSAYADVSPVLQCIAEELGKSKEELVIYDPYYCKGSMVSHMAGLGYTNVINRNRDFYEDIATKAIPGISAAQNVNWNVISDCDCFFIVFTTEFDVMVTNPPYSGEHKQKLLTFLMNRRVKKPFALLLPAYTVTKSYWRDFVTETEKRNKKRNGETVNNSSFIYILPSTSYNYDHPEGTGHKVPPFYSAWLIGGFSDITRYWMSSG